MASRRTSMSLAGNAPVYLSCGHCNNRLGVFENEWVRLTSSYARAKNDGTHMGTEIGNKIKHVPAASLQKAAVGCGMAEIFCTKCSSLVGQYCKSAPNAEQRHLVNNHFYKLSRTYLLEPGTSQRVEPVFGYAGDIAMPPPRSRASMRLSVQPNTRPRLSVRPSLIYAPRDSLCTFSEMDAGYRQSVDINSSAEMREDSVVAERLSLLERRVSEYESNGFHQSRAMTPLVGFGHLSQDGSRETPFSQQTPEQGKIVEDQRKQITALTSQIEILHGTIQDLRSLVQEIRSENRPQMANPASAPEHAVSSFEDMVAVMRKAHGENHELANLHDENKHLRAKLALIENAMGMKPGALSQAGTDSETIAIAKDITRRDDEASMLARFSNDPATAQSNAQLPTPSASQQVCMSDQMLVDDCDIQFRGDDEIDELAEVTLSASSTQTLQEIDLTAKQSLSRDTSLPNVDVNSSQLMPEPMISRATSTEQQPTPQLSGLGTIKPAPEEQLLASRPMFGVIKPVSIKSAKKGRKVGQDEHQHREGPVEPAPRPLDYEIVDFSDDENPVRPVPTDSLHQPSTAPLQLHYGRGRAGPPAAPGVSPWAQKTQVSFSRSQVAVASFTLDSSSRSDGAGPTSGEIHINITRPEDVRQRIEREESGIKEPKKEKKVPLQTTEKLLNEELRELGLELWIGKDKSVKEYREAVYRARTEKRERKKQEALVKAGIVNPGGVVLHLPPIALPSEEQQVQNASGSNRKHKTLQSLRRTHSRAAKASKPLADVTDQQNVQTSARTSKKRKADNLEEAQNAQSKDHVKAPAAKSKARAKRGSGPKSQVFWPQPEAVTGKTEDGVKTRRQMRAAEIEKLDRLAQEAMEMDETTTC